MAKRKIMKELETITKNPMEGITVEQVGNDIFHWHAQIYGPPKTAYEGGLFVLDIKIPFDYPLKPPECHFETKIYHPNISKEGAMCLYVLKKGWRPIENISNVLKIIYSLLQTPDPEDPIDTEIGSQFTKDLPSFNKTAAEWTKKYATLQ
ncbi:hypothetical protein M9Y10_039876 [Tritrichomonas musculus]|uniref:UBC core domain-containing protein n=1 Tax=Tritrichomonas musculus TaxID=1915356 RepID=A0ABR2GQQ2_9EUKA